MVQIYRFKVPALAPAHLDEARFQVAVPKAASGTYAVSVCADVLSQVEKFSEKHECRQAGAITVGHPGSGVKGYGPTGPEPPSPSPSPGGSSPPGGPTPASSPPDTAIDSGSTGTVGQSSATFAFHGSDANDTFQCSLDGAPWVACKSPQQYTSLADGTHTFQVRAVNSAGEVDPTPAEASWTVDTTAPAVTLTDPANGSWTNNVTPAFSGAAGTASGDSSTITVYLYAGSAASGTPVQTLTTSAVGAAWSVPASSALPQGAYTAQAQQSDAAGNLGKSTLSTFTVDTTPPIVTVSEPTNGSEINDSRPSFSGDAGTEPGDSSKITVNVYAGSSISGSPVDTLTATATSGSWSIAPASALADGPYTVQATQSDAAGNVGNSAPITFTIDTTPPAVTLATPANEATATSQKPTFSGAAGTAPGDSSTVTVDIYAGSAASGTPTQTLTATATADSWSVSVSSALANGTYTAQAHQQDAAGNVGSSAANKFTVNAVTPAITLTTPANGSATNDSTPTFSGAAGTASGDSSTVTVEIYSGSSVSGLPVQTLTTTQASGHWATVPLSALPDGTYTAQATQSNTDGNIGTSAPSTFTIDTIAPAVTLTTPSPGTDTNNNRPTFSGAAGTEPGDSQKVTLAIYAGSSASGTLVQTLTSTQSGGHWTTSPTTALADGIYTAEATQADSAGNIGKSSAVTFTVDTTPPVTTIDSAPSGKVATGAVEIKFSSNKPGSTFQCSLDSVAFSACTSPLKTANLAAGPHTFTVRATDKAGNTDPHPPTAEWDSVAQEVDLCGPILHNQTLSPEYASVYVLTCGVTVEQGVKLTAEPGAIIKAEAGALLVIDGSLAAGGTPGSPVTFTSINDNTVGGATGNGLPIAGDWGGIQVLEGGSVSLTDTDVRYGLSGLSGGGAKAAVTVLGGVWADFTSSAINVDAGPAQVENVSVSGAGSDAFAVSSEQLDLNKLSGNSATGGVGGFLLEGTVSTSSTWHSQPAPWVLSACDLTIAKGATVNVQPGTVVKGAASAVNCSGSGPGVQLRVEGALEASGTSASPVTFTSIADDTVGGDTNGDGNATSPAAGDWGGIQVLEGGSVSLTDTAVNYATTGINTGNAQSVEGIGDRFNHDETALALSGSTPGAGPTFEESTIANATTGIILTGSQAASFHGTIVETAVGAKDSSGATLDIRNTNWGVANGPAPLGDGPFVEGAGILVYPWVGEPAPITTPTPISPSSSSCAGVLFIGVDGSGETPPQTEEAHGEVIPRYEDMQNLYLALKAGLETDTGDNATMRLVELNYPADHTEELAQGFDGWDKYYQSYLYGVYGSANPSWPGLVPTIEAEYKHCPNEQLVVAGYSQGAWVVHDALSVLETQDPAAVALNRVAGVVLVADPEHGFEAGTSYGTAEPGAPGLITGGIGQLLGAKAEPIPEDLTPVSANLCNSQDLVCAPSSIEVNIGQSGVVDNTSFLAATTGLPFTFTEGIADGAQLHTGFEVHSSESPAPPGEYGCRWSTSPKCGSLLSQVAGTLAEEIATTPDPTSSKFSFTEHGGASFTAHLTVTSEMYSFTPFNWAVESPFVLPAGIELSDEGVIKGSGATPGGTYTFNAQVTANPTGSREVTRSTTVELTIE
jgi:hypothetical protein